MPANSRINPKPNLEKIRRHVLQHSVICGLPDEHRLARQWKLDDPAWIEKLKPWHATNGRAHLETTSTASQHEAIGIGQRTVVRRLPSDVMMLQLMLDLQLARPSTYLHHASRIARRYMTPTGRPNRLAYTALEFADKTAPMLCRMDISSMLDSIICSPNRKHHVDRIEEALQVLGFSKADLFGRAQEKGAHAMPPQQLHDLLIDDTPEPDSP